MFSIKHQNGPEGQSTTLAYVKLRSADPKGRDLHLVGWKIGLGVTGSLLNHLGCFFWLLSLRCRGHDRKPGVALTGAHPLVHCRSQHLCEAHNQGSWTLKGSFLLYLAAL